MSSALYEGTLRHVRRTGPHHAFSHRIAMPYLDLAELDEVFARHPLWSLERTNAVSFRRVDFLGDPSVPLDTAVRDVVEARLGRRPPGPIRMLGHVRTWGWLFNPLTVYVCAAVEKGVDALVLEVTNTPWHERHAYVLDGGEGEHRFPKELHVSPFLPMDQEYRLRFTSPGRSAMIQLSTLEGGTAVFDATLALRRSPLDRASMGRMLWRYPLLTTRVSLGIYTQAARLRAKGARFHPHPRGTAAPPGVDAQGPAREGRRTAA